MASTIEIFCCYARRDQLFLDELKTHLVSLQREGLINVWHDGDISPGVDWEKEITIHLNRAQIVVLLVSPDFIASEYCYSIEMKRAMERHERGEATVIPIILRPSDWYFAPFGKLQALPKNAEAITLWLNRDAAFLDAAKGIRKAVLDLVKEFPKPLPLQLISKQDQENQEKVFDKVKLTTMPKTRTSMPNSSHLEDLKKLFEQENDKLRLLSTNSSNTKNSSEEVNKHFEQHPFSFNDPQILTPSLVILLGTTAALAGLELMQKMLDLNSKDQHRVALVYIDTDDPLDLLIKFRQEHSGIFREYSTRINVPKNISHASKIPQSSENQGNGELEWSEQHTFISHYIPQYQAKGTGGIRNNGHVAACFDFQKIEHILYNAVTSITRLENDKFASRNREIQVNIVAFLGGGTGSGILPDITVMVRYLLASIQLRQRINLFCILPNRPLIEDATNSDTEPSTIISWGKSNAAACLLELLALSCAANGESAQYYEKYMRNKINRLTHDAIANEIYLFEQFAIGSISEMSRIVGFDLFQRITDASGVGFLEHSKWVDRRTLGSLDDRGLPTMFGSTYPIEIYFPAKETATVFAYVSTAHLLSILINNYSPSINVSNLEIDDWVKKWRTVAHLGSNPSDLMSIGVGQFHISDFEGADLVRLEFLWSILQKYEHDIETRLKEMLILKQQEEMNRINEILQQELDDISIFDRRIEYLQLLLQEYTNAYEDLGRAVRPTVPPRPVDMEARLVRQPFSFKLLNFRRGDNTSDVSKAYNDRLLIHARVTRDMLLMQLLKDLSQTVQEALNHIVFAEKANVEKHAKLLEEIGKSSKIWEGRLNNPHTHQRHIYDLASFDIKAGRSIALERLYRWASNGSKVIDEDVVLDLSNFINKLIDYISQDYSASDNVAQRVVTILQKQKLNDLIESILDFFQVYYIVQFQDINLFELLEIASPIIKKGQQAEQISNLLYEHLQSIRRLLSSSVIFEPELWHEGISNLDTSIYLGVHIRNSIQNEILEKAFDNLGSFTNSGLMPIVSTAIDPHRLQVSYGQHAISLRSVLDYYRDHNSAMGEYLFHQNEWEKTDGRGISPVHSSGEMERLIRDPNALGYKDAKGQGMPLPQRVIRAI